ncbi:MAG: hypothetical protein K2J73_10565 [Oscillospiraceae bacterium]|nr:hypothetical protein [Oscillospiraceae bacterium]
MLETKLLLLFGICLAVVLINGFVIVKFYSNGSRETVPVIIIPLTSSMGTPEFIVRNCVYQIAEKYPETIVAAINFGVDNETIHIFEKLMKHSCQYEIINSEDCSENICKIWGNMV